MEEIKKQELPQLVHQSSTYKLIVPEKVEEKIRYLIRKYPQTEWSGVLFYNHTGTFEGNDLVITCEDIFPMDLGSAGWTEFKMNEDVAAYMAQNIELFDYDMGLVHSHHSMGAFFSGQDNKMLQQEGDDTNCFVSLVVDTRGQYVARITRKVQSKSEVTVKDLGTSYKFFGEGDKDITKPEKEVTKVIEKEIIEYFDLDVERHIVINSLDYLDIRFEEIVSRKKPESLELINSYKELGSDFDIDAGYKRLPKEQNLFDDMDSQDCFNWEPSHDKVWDAVVHLITCSFTVNTKNFDLKQWTVKHLTKVYKRIFGNTDTPIESEAFVEWSNFITDYIVNYFDEECLLKDVDNDLYINKVATALIVELDKLPDNPYIDQYIKGISFYVTV